jgi:hypothetical protein
MCYIGSENAATCYSLLYIANTPRSLSVEFDVTETAQHQLIM